MQTFSEFDGAILVDKPPGPTSHDVVHAVRKRFHIKKVGHCGTLDPNATGLLMLVLGRATRLSDKFIAADKVYAGTVKFGQTTDSYDADGQLVDTQPVPPLTVGQLNDAAQTFVGDQLQMPPMVSAVKKNGVPLYKLARKGIEVERKSRLIHVYAFKFSEYNEPLGCFQITCTKGTYVRSLAHELGRKIGCGAHLATLRRIAAGQFNVANAIQFDKLLAMPAGDFQKLIIPFLKLVEMVER